MAEKASGRAQGRSRPQAQKQNRQRQSKRNPDSGAGTREARNGNASSRRQGREQEPQESGGVGAAAGKVGETIKQHPITTAALGAGLTLLAAQGLRMAIGNGARGQGEEDEQDDSAQASRSEEEQGDEEDSEGEEDEGEEGGGFTGRLAKLGSKFGSAFRGSGDAIRRGAQSGFQQGREGAEQGWQNHPLVLCGVALAAGVAIGYMIPSTSQEDRLMGNASDKLTGRIRKGGQAFFRQGRSLAGRALSEAVSATARETEREGLTTDRLGKKVKRVLGNVRDAVANAVQEE